ncbi:chaperonin 10-like protein [Linnemannia elongata]|nr:chaperonin 10-like protein [Linnemannia elongata]
MFSSQAGGASEEDKSIKFTGWAAVPGGNGILQKWSYHPRPLVADEIEIEITHCGICGSDIHFSTEGWGPITRPAIPGHEIVGVVVKRGEDAAHQIGDRVGVGCLVSCCRGSSVCDWCRKGEDQFCANKTVTFNAPYKDGRGGISEGGFADRMRVYSDYAFKIPKEISSVEAASFFCAGITTYTPLKRYKAGPNTRLGVIGIGGLGHIALQWAAAMGCREIVAISGRDNKKEEAFKLGATKFINTSDKEQIKEAAKSIDLCLCTNASRNNNWEEYLSMMAPLSQLVLLALPEEPITFVGSHLVSQDVAIVGSHLGSKGDIVEMLEFAAKHGIRPWIEKRPFEDCNEACKDVHAGKPRYRIVLEMDPSTSVSTSALS